MKRRKGYFSISAVARMFSVHQQTIRLYEKEGLISPKRSEGNTRMFSEDDIDRLEEIINLTHKMGVNLAGVEIILRLQKKIRTLQHEMNKLFNKTQGQLASEGSAYKTSLSKQVKALHAIKKQSAILTETDGNEPEQANTQPEDIDDWSVDYEE